MAVGRGSCRGVRGYRHGMKGGGPSRSLGTVPLLHGPRTFRWEEGFLTSALPRLDPRGSHTGTFGTQRSPPSKVGKIPWTEEVPREGAAEPSAPCWPFQPTRRHPDQEKLSIAEPPAPEQARQGHTRLPGEVSGWIELAFQRLDAQSPDRVLSSLWTGLVDVSHS